MENEGKLLLVQSEEELSERIFDEHQMYDYIAEYAASHNMEQTLSMLPYAKTKHEGQFRKGKERVPYIYHPLNVACHALALGLDDDNLVSAALLHDVCEDCGVMPEELPVNEVTKDAVRRLTKTWKSGQGTKEEEDRYYAGIIESPIATLVKLLDRCQNVSSMVAAFNTPNLVRYVKETQEYFYPLMEEGKRRYPEYSNAIYLIRYQIVAIVEIMKRTLRG